ncbi:preprotein translocase subunit SecG [Glaciecola punicea ACAM 611]|jgi:preprotein translocase subunit SecG|uniref:Protein-export membrane protein SecG n=1 Tax=Glaciecola punicea ACAM 611 TaxID=1121923 RepID=H5TAB2_9ALTE|nr:preprotein translocase subunit SecG [Glaciecola punicea]OFA33505.1 preprotein translocase subunit SecG [Glaciecola punicea]GAB55239.1 preprotein translocase subunit SecG [Glaciecola punicea ACAM 611]
MLYEVLLGAYLIVAIMLVGFVLLQQGKGAEMGASFGAGGSNTVFGSGGSGNFMTRTTAVLATLFFTISLIIGGITAGTSTTVDEFETIEQIMLEQTPSASTDGSDFPVSVQETKTELTEEAPKAQDNQ